jgi:ectoine hydroxylase
VRLADEDLERFERDGYLVFPVQFSREEIALLKRRAAALHGMKRDERWYEAMGVTRAFFAMHTYDEAFRRLAAHPRLVHPAMQLLGGPVYLHQYKLNAKTAFDGEVWDWHQDYVAWGPIDGMPEPQALNVAVFLDEVTAANGPLLVIPGSHRVGGLDARHRAVAKDAPLWSMDRDTLKAVAGRGGCIAATGAAGSVVIFSSLLVHASPANISPFDRAIAYLSLAHADNRACRFERPEWIAGRDFTPIEPLRDDCLIELARGSGARPAGATSSRNAPPRRQDRGS